jgi:hypothetical protein
MDSIDKLLAQVKAEYYESTTQQPHQKAYKENNLNAAITIDISNR